MYSDSPDDAEPFGRENVVISMLLQGKLSTHSHPLQSNFTNNAADESSSKVTSSLSRKDGEREPTTGLSLAESGSRGRQLFPTRSLGSFQDEETAKGFEDPLLRSPSSHDPLANPVPTEDTLNFTPKASRRVPKSISDERAEQAAAEWDGYKSSIMQRFTSSGTITVSATFDIISREPKGRGRSVTAAHLQELEDPEKEAREEVKIISQQEYVARLRELNDEISQAWLNNERVAALRLSIKVAKLLSDSSVPQFYPTLFVLVTDVMDTVGNLVWNRIKKKAECDEDGNVISLLPVNFTADDVRQEAKDTCNNWFFRIGSVKELLPRIYLELAILRCVQFLQSDPPISIFQRLTMMVRGVTDPLAAAYVRLYLSRRWQALLPTETSASESLQRYTSFLQTLELPMPSSLPQSPRVCLIGGVKDYVILFHRVLGGEFELKYIGAGVDLRLYVMLTEPVFEWTIRCIFKKTDQEDMVRILELFRDTGSHDWAPSVDDPNEGSNFLVAVVVHYLVKNLPASFVGNDALNISKIVRSTSDVSMPQYMNYRLLGSKLCECSPPRELRITVLNDVWRVVMKYTDLTDYLSVADVFVEYILQACSEVELAVILRDIIKHVRVGEVTDGVLALLESIVFKLLTHYADLSRVLNLAHFVDLLDIFYGDTRISVYKRILTGVSRRNQQVRDPLARHFVFEAAKVLHDSLDSLSSDDDRRQITLLIVRFVQLADFGQDLEQHLTFLVDCRGSFADMDPLLVTVVHASNRLAMTTIKMEGSHSKGTTDFVKACLTFNEITIPSINTVVGRGNLFLETAEVALMNGLPSHAEGLLKSALTCVQDVASKDDLKGGDSDEGIVLLLFNVLSFLIVIPGHPELGALYIFRGLLNLIDSHAWLVLGRRRVQLFCNAILMLAALAQDHLPYHVQNMDSNDVHYHGDEEYLQEVEDLKLSLMEKVILSVKAEKDLGQRGRQALDTCNVLIRAFDVEKVRDVCTGLLETSAASVKRHSQGYHRATVENCRKKGLHFKAL